MKGDVDMWLQEFSNVVCTEPELTDRMELSINTGDAALVLQCPYNTSVTLKEAVGKEIDWLSEKGYVRRSQCEWGSPIVTVRSQMVL